MITKLKLVKRKNTNESDVGANRTAPDGGVNYGTKLLKELVYPWV